MPRFAFMYSHRGNPLLDAMQLRGRSRSAHESFDTDDVRALLRALSRKRPLPALPRRPAGGGETLDGSLQIAYIAGRGLDHLGKPGDAQGLDRRPPPGIVAPGRDRDEHPLEPNLALPTDGESTRRTIVPVSGPPRITRVLSRGDWMDETGEVFSAGTEERIPLAEKCLGVLGQEEGPLVGRGVNLTTRYLFTA